MVLKATVEEVRERYAFSERRACNVMTMAVSNYRYQSRHSDELLRTQLVESARSRPRFESYPDLFGKRGARQWRAKIEMRDYLRFA